VEPNQQKIVKLLSALIAASAIVVMAVLAVALDEEQTGTGTGTGTVATEAVGGMSTGATVTTTTPPTALPEPVAHPTMKAVVTQGLPLTAPSGSVGVGVDSRCSSADPRPAYLLPKSASHRRVAGAY